MGAGFSPFLALLFKLKLQHSRSETDRNMSDVGSDEFEDEQNKLGVREYNYRVKFVCCRR